MLSSPHTPHGGKSPRAAARCFLARTGEAALTWNLSFLFRFLVCRESGLAPEIKSRLSYFPSPPSATPWPATAPASSGSSLYRQWPSGLMYTLCWSSASGEDGSEEGGLVVSDGAEAEEVGLRDSGARLEEVGLRDSGVSHGRNSEEGMSSAPAPPSCSSAAPGGVSGVSCGRCGAASGRSGVLSSIS